MIHPDYLGLWLVTIGRTTTTNSRLLVAWFDKSPRVTETSVASARARKAIGQPGYRHARRTGPTALATAWPIACR